MNMSGLYGKLPTYGDFIQRNMSSAFVSVWDEWLQHFVAGAREKIGENWLDIYLTSPIWRFVFSPGVIDENQWAGILMPSVDQVGRYFPFTVAMRLPGYISPLEYIAVQSVWYNQVEDLALQSLDGEFDVDELSDELSQLDVDLDSMYHHGGEAIDNYFMHFELDFEEQSAGSIYPYILDVAMGRLLNSYSVWSTTGSELVAPCVFCSQNLPSVAKLPAMLDGRWLEWGWQQPFKLQVKPD